MEVRTVMLRRKNARGKGPPTEAVLEHAGAGPNRRPSPRTRHRATTKTPRPASRVSSPKSPKFTDSLLEGTQFELSSRCRSSGLPQGGSGGPSCRIPAEDSWRTSAAAPSPNDIRSALAKTQHKMAPSVRLLRVPGTKGSNLSSSSGESGTNSVIGSNDEPGALHASSRDRLGDLGLSEPADVGWLR